MKHLSLTLLALLLSLASFAQVAAIVGPTTICIGTTGNMTDATPGGAWSSSNPGVAAIGSSSGIVVGMAAGVTTISYIVGPSSATLSLTIDPLPAGITGPSAVCLGGTATEADVTVGGTWSIAAPTIATIAPTGVITGLSIGSTTITYTIGTGCMTSKGVTVTASPAAITGTPATCVGSTTTLSDIPGGGVWSSSNPAIASVGSVTGVVTGVGIGSTTISYSIGVGCSSTIGFTVSTTSALHTITGGGSYCTGGVGVHVNLSGSDAGSYYQLYDGGTPVGTPMAGTGSIIDFGLQTATGVYTIVANPGTSCTNTMTGSVTVGLYPLPNIYTVTGGGSYCAGGTGVLVGLSGSDLSISYQLYNGLTLVGAPVPGTGSPITFGLQTATGTYTVVATNGTTACSDNMSGTATVTTVPVVIPAVSTTIIPGTTVCAGTVVAFTAVPVNGGPSPVYQWIVDGILVATGVTYTYTPADADVVYAVMTSDAICASPTTATSATTTMTVSAPVTPTVSIAVSPGTSFCAGATVTSVAVVTGGGTMPTYQWSLNGVVITGATSATFISSTYATGDVLSVLVTSSAPCGTTGSSSVVMTIDIPTITASSTSGGCGGSVNLSAGGGSTYTWSPATGLSCTACSGPSVVPSSTTTYTVSGTDGTGCTGTATVTTDGNRISGFITYTGTPGTDVFTVWLIQFNPSDSSITALDSTLDCVASGTPYYEFMDKPAGNYMIKAKLNGAIPGTSGYVPTYSLSSPHWDSAATVSHTGAADSLHINMVYGTVPSGPGFISGFVYAGAGKGTSGNVPVAGMIIYLKNTSSATYTYTYTGTDGSYSFGSLANGDYIIYPEDYQYHTTPSSTITLSPTAESITAINFKQHTTSGTITPYDFTKVNQPIAATGISVCPNPTSGNLSIQWTNKATGTADVIITDVMGRQVYNTPVRINTPSGQTQIDLSDVSEGIYLITVISADIHYTTRLVRTK